jgi:hypothetical protein
MTSLKLALATSVVALMIGLAGGASASTGGAAPLVPAAVSADAGTLQVAEFEFEFDDEDFDWEDDEDCHDEDDCDEDDEDEDEWDDEFEFEVIL